MSDVLTASSDRLGDAEEALRLAQVEPERARDLARAVLESPGGRGDAAVIAAVAERALGLAARELDDMPAAVSHLRRSVDLATDGGSPVRAAQARMSLSLTLAYAGESEEALQQADLAAPALPPADRGRLELQRALILQRLGRLDDALEGYQRALPLLRRWGDPEDEARLLMNRGVAYAYRGDLRAAQSDLIKAADRFDQLGRFLYAAKARHNIGFVVSRRGNIPAALRWFDRAEAQYRQLGVPQAIGLIDRCETLLSVRLLPEARAAAEQAAKEFSESGMEADLAQARLLLAHVVLVQGDATTAAAIAEQARASFVAQNRPGWAAWASYLALRAAWTAGEHSPALLDAAAHVVEELVATGWASQAAEARLITAHMALDLGLVSRAEAELSHVSAVRRSGPADARARAWQGQALLRLARGDRRGADVALRAGVGILLRHQATLGATELRVHAGRRTEELASLGVRLALDDRRAERLLTWAERGRAAALRSRPALPPADAGVAELLAELRHVVSQLDGKSSREQDTAPLLRRQAALEARIRRKTWSTQGEGAGAPHVPPTAARLSKALGDGLLVEFVELDGDLHAVTVDGGRASLATLGPVSLVAAKVDTLRFALRRLASTRRSPGSGATRAFAEASRDLDRMLLGHLAHRLGDRSLVIVPAGPGHALPWSSLPSLRGRPVSVAPSATLWMRAAAGRTGGRGAVFVAGPGLRHGDDEIGQLSARYRRATILRGDDATTSRVAGALNGSDLVHIAAHGTFRADNPLFSSLQLVDGPLTVYDLERLRRAPRRIVLSACEAGQTLVAGDELMGLSSALLSLGAQTLIASVVTVSDEITQALMVELHRRLLRAEPPAEALAQAQVSIAERTGSACGPAGFACFGAG